MAPKCRSNVGNRLHFTYISAGPEAIFCARGRCEEVRSTTSPSTRSRDRGRTILRERTGVTARRRTMGSDGQTTVETIEPIAANISGASGVTNRPAGQRARYAETSLGADATAVTLRRVHRPSHEPTVEPALGASVSKSVPSAEGRSRSRRTRWTPRATARDQSSRSGSNKRSSSIAIWRRRADTRRSGSPRLISPGSSPRS